MTAARQTRTVRARWLARFGDDAALARRLAWAGRDEAWLEAAPGLMLADMRRRAARGKAFLRRIDPVAAGTSRTGGAAPDQVTALLHRATGWDAHALAPLAGQIGAETACRNGGPVQEALAWTSLAAAVAAAREAAVRLNRDAARLRAAFGFDAARLHRVEAMGDPHAGGRRVLRLQDGEGTAVFLKPRAPDGERLLARCAASLPDRRWLAPVPLLVRMTSFWMADAGQACAEPDAEQAGALLALADLVGAVDLHAENVRPTTAGVAVLDAEMVLHPDLPLDLVSPRGRAAARALRRGPLRTGLVPEPDRDAAVCGLKDWLPASRPGTGFAQAVLRAYSATLERLAAAPCRDAFRAAMARRGTVRLLARPTQGYARLLSALRDPGRTADPADAFLLMELLRIGMARHGKRRPAFWHLPASEEAALLSGDVPRLWMEWGGVEIHEGGAGPTGAVLPASPRAAASARAARLDATSRSTRVAQLRRALRQGFGEDDTRAPPRGTGGDHMRLT